MASLQEHKDRMTVFYSLATKEPRLYCTGIQDMSYFGTAKDDYNYGVLITDYDEFVIRNFDKFIVENETLIFKDNNYVIKKRNV